MDKGQFFKAVVLSLVLIGIVNAHSQTACQHVTLKTSDLFSGFCFWQLSDGLSCGKSTRELISNSSRGYTFPGYSFLSEKGSSLKVSRICRQIIAGELSGILFGFWCAGISGALIPSKDEVRSDGPTFAGIEYVMGGFYLGYVVGNGLGVYVLGNDRYGKGSFLATLGGSIIGGLIGVSNFFFLDNKNIGVYLSVLGPPVGSLIGFYLSWRPIEPAGNAFIIYDHGKLKWSLRSFNVCYGYDNKPIINLNLFQVNF
ncbi:hypothetical protein J7K97_04835 [Candidatus Aerophobetes bacterium]|nr:hypothetical protein [Candidatus Aerophobetes bacterium]